MHNEGFTYVGCDRPVLGDEAWAGETARPALMATWADLIGNSWEWAICPLGVAQTPNLALHRIAVEYTVPGPPGLMW